MNFFNRGVQSYLLVLAFIAALAIVWGTNIFVLERTTSGTGWPSIVGIAVMLVLLGVLVRRWWLPHEPLSASEQYPWTSR